MSSTEINIVYRPRSSLLDIIDVADANGWKEVQRFERGEQQLEELVFELPDGETVVRGIDDHFVTVVIASVTGPNKSNAEDLLRSSGATLADEVLWDWAAKGTPEERSYALRAFAAVTSDTANPQVIAAYQNALEDAHPLVRQALVDAVGRASWQELWPVAEKLLQLKAPGADTLIRAYEKHLPKK